MVIIQSREAGRIAAPSSLQKIEDVQAWLTSMSDSGWRIITDFGNWPSWMPGVRAAMQVDSESPARGSKLSVDMGQTDLPCSIDVWDPPRSLHISIKHAADELAYGFLIETNARDAEIEFSLEIEQSLGGLARFVPFYSRWRLRAQGRQLLDNLIAAVRNADGLSG